MRVISCNTAVLGAGCAGLNAADELKKAGVDVMLFCDGLRNGTSFNAGSDKQTYYRLGLDDSTDGMARVLYHGGATHGDHAKVMAALSARCFYKLVQLGVPFPHNKWGEYVGYRTDHDESFRATSCGPLTSRDMGEALLKSVLERKIPVVEGVLPVALLDGGLMLANDAGEILLVNAVNIVIATGSPALIYGNTVYPARQLGATGIALRKGARASNLCYWQYGLASTAVRWNVSGSYQQAIPDYVDEDGARILPEEDRLEHVFLKGYQWPFDARKKNGSSRVDLAVREATQRGKRVFLEYRRVDASVPERISGEAKAYLENCGATGTSAIERLRAINESAYRFYRDRGIDLAKEPLEIALCAQHCNGGLRVDEWWRTDIPNVYACGEAAGAFGVTRPGGSALNETQVASLRAAQHISAHAGRVVPPCEQEFLDKNAAAIREEQSWLAHAKEGGGSEDWDAAQLMREAQREMDSAAGAVRDIGGMEIALQHTRQRQNRIGQKPKQAQSIRQSILLRDLLAVQRATLFAMLLEAKEDTARTHMVAGEAESPEKVAVRAVLSDLSGACFEPIRPIPEGDRWVETVWKEHGEGAVFG